MKEWIIYLFIYLLINQELTKKTQKGIDGKLRRGRSCIMQFLCIFFLLWQWSWLLIKTHLWS